jgi:hypothetical protein
LHRDDREVVSYLSVEPEVDIMHSASGGIEILILDGGLVEGGVSLGKGAWLRLPDGEALLAAAGPEGAKLWMKTGHLPYAQAPDV